MNSELRELYQQVILDHNKSPRNFRKIVSATRHVEGRNPLCGDRLDVYVTIDGDQIADVAFEGSGCAISKASASLMTTMVKGRTVAEAEKVFGKFHALVTTPMDKDPGDLTELGKLAVFAGVREFPARVKCASLCWHTLRAALHGDQIAVSTE